MILGIGTDLLDIRRIERTLDRYGDRFCERIYTVEERRRCDRKVHPAAGYAQHYAAKEACAKALGTGFRQGVAWRDIEVVHRPSGQPTLRLSGGAWRRMQTLTPPEMLASLDISLTDEYPYAQAIVILSARLPVSSVAADRALRAIAMDDIARER